MPGPHGSAPAEVLFSAEIVSKRLDELAAEVSDMYRDRPRPPILVGVLKGSALFLADLIRKLTIDCELDFMAISSYGTHSGVVRIEKDLEHPVEGRDVLIVEDIVDTGLTLNYLRRALSEREPASLRTVTLLDKAVRCIVPVDLELAGFEIGDVFVVGYGLDFQGRYRNVRDMLEVKDLARLANDPLLLVDHLWPRR